MYWCGFQTLYQSPVFRVYFLISSHAFKVKISNSAHALRVGAIEWCSNGACTILRRPAPGFITALERHLHDFSATLARLCTNWGYHRAKQRHEEYAWSLHDFCMSCKVCSYIVPLWLRLMLRFDAYLSISWPGFQKRFPQKKYYVGGLRCAP